MQSAPGFHRARVKIVIISFFFLLSEERKRDKVAFTIPSQTVMCECLMSSFILPPIYIEFASPAYEIIITFEPVQIKPRTLLCYPVFRLSSFSFVPFSILPFVRLLHL